MYFQLIEFSNILVELTTIHSFPFMINRSKSVYYKYNVTINSNPLRNKKSKANRVTRIVRVTFGNRPEDV